MIEVIVPQGVTAEATPGMLVVTGQKGKLEKKFDSRRISVEVKEGKITITPIIKASRQIMAAVHTVEAHAKNMITGVTKGFEKKLSVVFAHFPITVEAKGKEIMIKNFLGEKLARKANVVGETKVVVSGQEITVSGSSREDVGQTAANIVEATVIRARDERVFQDGVYYA